MRVFVLFNLVNDLRGDLDERGLFNNVSTLNFHLHPPHYALTEDDGSAGRVRQPIDPDRRHPFTAAANREFNNLLWLPPNDQRAGDIVMVDSTNFMTLLGGTESLAHFWKNLAAMTLASGRQGKKTRAIA